MSELNRGMGLFHLTMYGVGLILGAGIYVLIGEAAGFAGDAVWIAFVLGAIVALFAGLSYAELSSIFPKAAAEYTFVKNAFKNLAATVKSGGLEKTLDIDSDPQAGHYHSKIIPTRTGNLVVELKGDINGIPINSEITIEDVEDKSLLTFPDTTGSSDQDVVALKNAVSGLQTEVTLLKSKISGMDTTSGTFSAETAYNFGIFGLSLGATGVILAIVAMIKRK